MKSPKVSVIIPVYNVEKYLRECLESVINQTLKEIEIICVNDCSTDGSLNILKEYAEKDNRVVLVDKPQNQGTMLARKSGVEAACGEYCIFLDADDYIDLDLCQFIYEETQKDPVDIIHFPMGVFGAASGINIDNFITAMSPCAEKISGHEVIKSAYIDRKFASQLCGKAVKTSVCKQAFLYLPNEKCHVGEDVFSFFIISLFAESYKGYKTKPYYIYRFGVGVSNLRQLKLEKFELFCKMSNWYRYAQNIIDKLNCDEIHKTAAKAMASRLFDDCSEMLDTRIAYNDKTEAVVLMAQYWADIPVADESWVKNTGLDKSYFINQAAINEYVNLSRDESSVPWLSLVLIADNNAQHISEQLEKFASMKNDHLAVICVNNGSADNTEEILDGYCKKYDWISVVNCKKRGVAYARNQAVKYIKSEYFCFVDDINSDFATAFADIDIDIPDIFCILPIADGCISGTELLKELSDKAEDFKLQNYIFNKKFWDGLHISFNESMKYHEMPTLCNAILSADKIKFLNLKSTSNEIYISKTKTAEEFIELYKLYIALLADNIIDDKKSENIAILNNVAQSVYMICSDIYCKLNIEESKKVDKYLPEEYKSLFFNVRELKKLKNSLSYRIGKKITKYFDK